MPLKTSFVAAAEEINAFCILIIIAIIAIYDEILRSYVSGVANFSLRCFYQDFWMEDGFTLSKRKFFSLIK